MDIAAKPFGRRGERFADVGGHAFGQGTGGVEAGFVLFGPVVAHYFSGSNSVTRMMVRAPRSAPTLTSSRTLARIRLPSSLRAVSASFFESAKLSSINAPGFIVTVYPVVSPPIATTPDRKS